jgi:hypothetical protein
VKIPLEKWLFRRLRKGWKNNIKVELIKGVWLMIGPSSKTLYVSSAEHWATILINLVQNSQVAGHPGDYILCGGTSYS